MLEARNVCAALPAGLDLLMSMGRLEESRGGPVLVAPFPVLTLTLHPQERVLFSPVRNANPFFHLFEAFWMLAGRDDAAPLNAFIKGFGSMFGEEDGTIHGAYGMRWRQSFGFDQLNFVVEKLKAQPATRQCVIQMWDCGERHADLTGNWQDRPCNDVIFLRINDKRLDLTVCCRSNDIIWGAYGANAVHFSILQEYLAARLGVGIGFMYQLSNNFHAYTKEFERLRADPKKILDDRYSEGHIKPMGMFDKPGRIDDDIATFMECYEAREFPPGAFANHWFESVLGRAMIAHHRFKNKNMQQALWYADQIAASDWRVACKEWLERRANGQGAGL